jgi:hypothetical protein
VTVEVLTRRQAYQLELAGVVEVAVDEDSVTCEGCGREVPLSQAGSDGWHSCSECRGKPGQPPGEYDGPDAVTCEDCGKRVPQSTTTPHENAWAEWFLCAECESHDETCVCEACRPDLYEDGYEDGGEL